MVRTPEALRHQAPGEWGALLGLDRCPEVKTLRRKIRALGRDPQRVRAWQNALAEAWVAAEPEVCADTGLTRFPTAISWFFRCLCWRIAM